MSEAVNIAPATGRLGVLLPGLGAVSTTLIAGVLALRKGLAQPIGSLTQLGVVRLGKRTDHREVLVRDLVPLAKPDGLVFGGWDIFPDDVYTAARKAGVLERELLDQLRPELEAIAPMRRSSRGALSGIWTARMSNLRRGTARASRRCALISASSARRTSWSAR